MLNGDYDKTPQIGRISKQELDFIVDKTQNILGNFSQRLVSIFQECDIDGNQAIEGDELIKFETVVSETTVTYMTPKPIIEEGTSMVIGLDRNTLIEKNEPIRGTFYQYRRYFQQYQQSLPYDIFNCSKTNIGNVDNEAVNHFDAFLKSHKSNLSNQKIDYLEKIKNLLEKGEIQFKNAISDSKLMELALLDDEYLNFFIKGATLWNKQEELDNEVVQDLLNDDYFAFNKIPDKNYNQKDDLRIIHDKYKEIKGISFYNNLINKYEKSEISKELFINNMNKILKTYGLQNSELYQNLNNMEIFELQQLKDFDFDKYVANSINYNYGKYTNPNNPQFKYLHFEETVNLKETWLESYIPNIENKKVDDNTIIQKINGTEYEIKYGKESVFIKNCESQKQWELNFDKLLMKITDSEDKEIVKKTIKNLPATVLRDISKNVKYFIVENDIQNSENAWINHAEDDEDNSPDVIHINLACIQNLETIIAHEVGHVCDIHIDSINNNELKRRMVNFKEHILDNYDELKAEMYAFFYTGSTASSNNNLVYFLQNDFLKANEYFKQREELLK